jgi:lycopene cyclase domain-containing protein
MPEYTVLAVLSVVLTVGLERVMRTGLFARLQYWLAMLIVFAFQVPVDGWLTKLSAPIVIYAPEHHLGVRWPWDIPVEDYLFGFSMVTLSLILWERAKERSRVAAARSDRPDRADQADTRSSA